MTYSPTDSRLFGPLFSDPKIGAEFRDEQFMRYLLEVEAALARVQGTQAIIPAAAAEQIAERAPTLALDWDRLQAATERAGFPIIELVAQIRKAVGAEAAEYVHWGATTQDIMDTALILQLRNVLVVLGEQLDAVITQLATLAEEHRHTLMAGRTHAQQALPITFGLKVAGWLAPLLRHRRRLAELRPRLLVVQFGGAAGTLAALGTDGIAVQQALAAELGLGCAPMPWHTQRDHLVEFAGWLSLLTGSLAKMAQDIILLAQSEVAEVNESDDRTRGGSSTMPQKSNPIVSELIIAAARTNASLLSSLHNAQIHEHERATHGWQMEWLALPQMVGLTGAALTKARFLSENLVIDATQMARNVAASNGLMLAEAVSFVLAEQMPRAEAKVLVTKAVAIALAEERHLVDVVQAQVDLPVDWAAVRDEHNYLGATQLLIDQVLTEVKAMNG
ncbi:MAG: 3-carboxy-cis,cis-muconate cycloisomerase [Caldilineaceae bacterium]